MTLVKYKDSLYKYIDTLFINCGDVSNIGIKSIIAPVDGGAIQVVDVAEIEYVPEQKPKNKQALHS